MTTVTADIMGLESWWHQAMTSGLSIGCLAVCIGCLAAISLGIRAIVRLGRPHRQSCRQSQGTATIEFALVMPVMLFLIMLLAQTTFVMAGNLFVHYAAFAATRSAIVYIPADYGPDEAPNVLLHEPGSVKFDAIRAAAAIALAPAAGPMPHGNAPAEEITTALEQYYEAYGRSPPRWTETLIANRFRYAYDQIRTRVTVMHTFVDDEGVVVHADTDEAGEQFGPTEPVTVRVEHQLNLSVPIVWTLFADDTDDGAYTMVAAQYTMINEGVVDALPPTPSLPRYDPPT